MRSVFDYYSDFDECLWLYSAWMRFFLLPFSVISHLQRSQYAMKRYNILPFLDFMQNNRQQQEELNKARLKKQTYAVKWYEHSAPIIQSDSYLIAVFT